MVEMVEHRVSHWPLSIGLGSK